VPGQPVPGQHAPGQPRGQVSRRQVSRRQVSRRQGQLAPGQPAPGSAGATSAGARSGVARSAERPGQAGPGGQAAQCPARGGQHLPRGVEPGSTPSLTNSSPAPSPYPAPTAGAAAESSTGSGRSSPLAAQADILPTLPFKLSRQSPSTPGPQSPAPAPAPAQGAAPPEPALSTPEARDPLAYPVPFGSVFSQAPVSGGLPRAPLVAQPAGDRSLWGANPQSFEGLGDGVGIQELGEGQGREGKGGRSVAPALAKFQMQILGGLAAFLLLCLYFVSSSPGPNSSQFLASAPGGWGRSKVSEAEALSPPPQRGPSVTGIKAKLAFLFLTRNDLMLALPLGEILPGPDSRTFRIRTGPRTPAHLREVRGHPACARAPQWPPMLLS